MSLFKKIILGLWLSSFIGYLEWGTQQQFIGSIEYELLINLGKTPEALLHPFILIPLLGQILLLVSLFTNKPKYWLVLTAASGIAILFVMLLFIGILSWNPKISLLTFPFLGFYIGLLVKRKKLIFE